MFYNVLDIIYKGRVYVIVFDVENVRLVIGKKDGLFIKY